MSPTIADVLIKKHAIELEAAEYLRNKCQEFVDTFDLPILGIDIYFDEQKLYRREVSIKNLVVRFQVDWESGGKE